MTRENIATFENRNNVTKITADNGSVSYLTASVPFVAMANSQGAVGLNTYENANKHVLFLFSENGVETSRHYLGKKLQGKTPAEIAAIKHNLCCFESYNPDTKSWVPCIGYTSQEDLSKTMVRF
jgi:hypothetical protein